MKTIILIEFETDDAENDKLLETGDNGEVIEPHVDTTQDFFRELHAHFEQYIDREIVEENLAESGILPEDWFWDDVEHVTSAKLKITINGKVDELKNDTA